MPGNSYDEVPYPTVPMAQTHPDRLASVAALFGMTPAPVNACRVLEIGCGNGGNLIPMAWFLPGSRFTGIDLAEEPIAEARRAARELGLRNLEFIAMDLRAAGPAMGEFDYIVAHGLYSWIPEDARGGLLAVCRERLAPQGVAFISYNALPGRHVRMMMREMLQYHTRDCADAGEKIEQARRLLEMVGEARLVSRAWQPMIEEEIGKMLAGSAGWFFHDDLAPVNEAFSIRDFAARAARHGLQYLGDAEGHLMFDIHNALGWLDGDIVEREQYFDFLCFRAFRQTLLCRAGVKLRRPADPEQMDRFLFSSPARASEGRIEGLHGVSIGAGQENAAQVAAAMGEVYPLPIGFEQLLPYAADRGALREMLFALISSGFAQFHVYDFAPAGAPSGPAGPRRRASRLVRWESARGDSVTYSSHTVLKLDGMVRALIELLDGTRDFEGVVSALARVEGAPPAGEIQARLPHILAHMARTGLLEA